MLVTSSQSSTQRPLGLSVEELFALDRQYRRIEQQQQHLAQLQAQTRVTSSNLNRLASRSLDLISSPSSSSSNPLTTALPSLEVHGQAYTNRLQQQQIPIPNVLNYPRSNSIDHLRYVPPPPPPPVLKHNYPQRSRTTDVGQQNYESKYRTYFQQPMISTGNSFMYDLPPSSSSMDYSDNRGTCKLRRQQPIKRESSRRIVVRPVVHRRREPSISSSCESLDEARSSISHLPVESNKSILFTPSTSLIEDVINDLTKETNKLTRSQSNHDSLSDDGEINLYEMRVPIGKTYDTYDISVQLEGSKILIHCHTIEPTDKRGNYRKHEYKSELLIPDIVDDETIVAYLTEDGQLIVEGKYHLWAWKEMKQKKYNEQEELNNTILKNDGQIGIGGGRGAGGGGGLEKERILTLNNNQIEKLDNNRTLIHVGDTKSSVSDIINRFNTLNIWDGQYTFTNDIPPILLYHLRLPFETLMDAIRIQSDSELNLLKIFIEEQEENDKLMIRSTSRLCRLPKDYKYDYNNLRLNFFKDNFIRIEIPTLN